MSLMSDRASQTRGVCSGCRKNVRKLKNGNAASHTYTRSGVKPTKCPGSGKPCKSLYRNNA